MKKFVFLVALVGALAASSSSPSSAAFCNTTGYPGCDTRDGTACTTPGTSVRCVANANYCEWGVCRCTSTYTWSCIA